MASMASGGPSRKGVCPDHPTRGIKHRGIFEQAIEEGRRGSCDAGMGKQRFEVRFDPMQFYAPEFEYLLDGHTRHGSLLGQIRRL